MHFYTRANNVLRPEALLLPTWMEILDQFAKLPGSILSGFLKKCAGIQSHAWFVRECTEFLSKETAQVHYRPNYCTPS